MQCRAGWRWSWWRDRASRLIPRNGSGASSIATIAADRCAASGIAPVRRAPVRYYRRRTLEDCETASRTDPASAGSLTGPRPPGCSARSKKCGLSGQPRRDLRHGIRQPYTQGTAGAAEQMIEYCSLAVAEDKQAMLERLLIAQVVPARVVVDAVYGESRRVGMMLEDRTQLDMLALLGKAYVRPKGAGCQRAIGPRGPHLRLSGATSIPTPGRGRALAAGAAGDRRPGRTDRLHRVRADWNDACLPSPSAGERLPGGH